MSIPAGFKGNQWGWFYKSDNSGPYYLDADGVMCQGLPSKFYTDGNGAGPSSRLRVDVGETGFYAGRDFRTFKEITLAANATIQIKATFTTDAIVQGLGIGVDSGYAILRVYNSSITETVPFTDPLPVIGANRMDGRPTPYYSSGTTWLSGGEFTGGTLLDVIHVKSGGNTNQASTHEGVVPGARGIPAGSYYLRITNMENSDTSVVFKSRWEERSPGI
jgi:hypothetical protein